MNNPFHGGVGTGSGGSRGTGGSPKRKLPLNFDMNEEYVSGNSSPENVGHHQQSHHPVQIVISHSIPEFSSTATVASSSQPTSGLETKRRKKYEYIPRKPVEKLSQNKGAIQKRLQRQEMRKNKPETYLAQLELNRVKGRPKEEKLNELTKIQGKSSRPWNTKVREARERKRQGIQTQDDLNLIQHSNDLYKKSQMKKKQGQGSGSNSNPPPIP